MRFTSSEWDRILPMRDTRDTKRRGKSQRKSKRKEKGNE